MASAAATSGPVSQTITPDDRNRPRGRSSDRAATSSVRPSPAPNQAGGQDRSLTARRWRRTSSSTAGTSSSGSSSTSRSSSSRCTLTHSVYAARLGSLRYFARARYVPDRTVNQGDSWSITAIKTRCLTCVPADQRPCTRSLPSWSCGFDSRRPLCWSRCRSARSPVLVRCGEGAQPAGPAGHAGSIRVARSLAASSSELAPFV